jgi:glucose/arabinose dehydrogenase
MRSVVEGPDGSLFVSTDMGASNDAIMKISPGP